MSGLSVVSRMAQHICKLRAADDGEPRSALFRPHSAIGSHRAGSTEQSVAPTPRAKFHVIAAMLCLLIAAPWCAETSAGIDAALPLDASTADVEGWRIFRLSTLRHARVAADTLAWRGGMPQVSDSDWLKLATPTGPFRPVQVVPGQRGYFYLVDAASGRLCLYDADAALLSIFPLPREFVPFRAGRVAVFRGADGAFTFLDYASGEASQFADRQTADAGASGWIPRGRTKLPAGVKSCVQAAGSAELFCLGGEGVPLRFDGALNRIALRSHPEAASQNTQDARRPQQARVVWDAQRARWNLRGEASGRILFALDAESKSWIVLDSLSGAGASPSP